MQDFLDTFLLFGLPIAVLVPFIVEGLKKLFLPDDWAGLAAVVVAAVLVGLVGLINWHPELAPIVRYILGALLLGLSAAGLYSQKKQLTGK